MPEKSTETVPKSRAYLRGIERLQCIDREVQKGHYPNCGQLKSAIEKATGMILTRRTVLRDLAAMRDQFRAPLEYCPKRRGYYYKKPGFALPLQKFTEGDFLAFFIAEYALRFIGHTPAAETLTRSLAKLASFLPEQVSVNLASLGDNLSFATLPFASTEWEKLDALRRAVTDGRTVEFNYFSPHSQKATSRRADPYHLHCDNGDWFVISFDHERREMRDFHAARISNLKVMDKYFDLPTDWDAAEYLKRGFLMMRGGRLTTVEIHFDAYQAQWIRERHRFHPDEQREELPDGSLRLSFNIGEQGLDAVARFCLTYTGHCRVEKPKKLRELVREKLQKGMELHR